MFHRSSRSVNWIRSRLRIQRLTTAAADIPEDLTEALSWMKAKDPHLLGRQEFAALLRKCGSVGASDAGRCVHDLIQRATQMDDVFLANLLVEMYGKCGCIVEARSVFNSLQQRNVFSWTIIIAANVNNGHYNDAIKLSHQMILEGLKPDIVFFLTALDACAATADLQRGKLMHECITACGLEFCRPIVGNTLINMYGKCRSLEEARILFDRMHHQRDVVTWNALLVGYAQNGGLPCEVLQLFRRMDLEGMKPTNVTFSAALDACSVAEDLLQGRTLHSRAAACGCLSDAFVINALVKMYAKCGSLEESRQVFESTTLPKDLITWNVMISAAAQSGSCCEALHLLQKMDLEGCPADEVTFVSVVDACTQLNDLQTCRSVHEMVVCAGFDQELVLGNAIISMFGKCGCLRDAAVVFDDLPSKNVVSWNCIISAYAQNDSGQQALKLLKNMDLEGVKANSVTYVSVIDACCTSQDLATGAGIHQRVAASGLENHVVVATALINMYGKCQDLETSWELLQRLPCKGLFSWNVMVSAYAQHRHGKEATRVVREIDLEGLKADEVTYVGALDACACSQDFELGKSLHDRVVATGWVAKVVVSNTLINMYGKCGRVSDALAVFNAMQWRDCVSWNAAVAAHAQNGHVSEAVRVLWRMQAEGVRPQEATFVTLVDACGESASLALAKAVHAAIENAGAEASRRESVGGALVSMYGRCGSVEEARRVFDALSCRSFVSWTSMLSAYAHTGHAWEALELFEWMQQEGVVPDEMTFAALVFGCSHAGLLEEALRKLGCMSEDYGMSCSRGQFECLVDVLARLGRLEEAEELVNSMPYEPQGLAWMALLGACKVHGDVQRAARAAGQERVSMESGRYMLLSSAYIPKAIT